MSKTPLLDQIHFPADLKKLSREEIKKLAGELRYETISAVSKTGGHLGAGLGVVELTCALHQVFNAPHDKLIWDVGHQAYPHKILTGRREKMRTIRQPKGLSGFTKRTESEFDPFGAGHSSTSISAALGISVAKKIKKEKSHVIAVIGDGAMSGGMAFEGFAELLSNKHCMKKWRKFRKYKAAGNMEAQAAALFPSVVDALADYYYGFVMQSVTGMHMASRQQRFYPTLVASYHGLSLMGMDMLSSYGYTMPSTSFLRQRKVALENHDTTIRYTHEM